MRNSLSVVLLAVAVMSLAPAAHAGLIGSTGITWYFPDTSTSIATDTIAVGSSLNCPGASPICSGFGGNTVSFSVASTSISYNFPGVGNYATGSFNGFDFTGLTFADAGSLLGFGLVTNMTGLTAADVSFTAHSIEINLQGLSATGTFTLNLSEAASVPEPGFLAPVGAVLAGLAVFIRRRRSTLPARG